MGIDVSTQSITVTVVNIGSLEGNMVCEYSLSYAEDASLLSYGIDKNTLIIPTENEGEAMQPPVMFLKALDAILHSIKDKVHLADVKVVSVSAQQHGHVYLGNGAKKSFEYLHSSNDTSLESLFDGDDVFAFPYAPIWMMTGSKQVADEIREKIGTKRIMKLSGSESPARFTGAVMKYIARTYPNQYIQTQRVHLLSSFITGILVGNYDAPIDWGNGSGMTLMDYHQKEWSEELASVVSEQGNAQEVISKLPALSKQTDIVGNIAPYFMNKYGFTRECMVSTGSGDNPQSKVPVRGDLLSLGTSFVIMASGTSADTQVSGTNAMYDGVNNPFVFACRTNGALLWDRVRKQLQMNFDSCDEFLCKNNIGISNMMWQPIQESFPMSKKFDMQHAVGNPQDYAGVVDSTLALMNYYSKDMMKQDVAQPIYITGGPSNSKEIIRRIAAFWNRPVVKVRSTGASFGAAISAYVAYQMYNKVGEGELRDTLYKNIIPQLLDAQPAYIACQDDIVQAALYEKNIVKQFTALK